MIGSSLEGYILSILPTQKPDENGRKSYWLYPRKGLLQYLIDNNQLDPGHDPERDKDEMNFFWKAHLNREELMVLILKFGDIRVELPHND